MAEDDLVGTVIFAVAAARDVNPMELETPLFDAIDTDALEQLFAREDTLADMQVEFTWAGCRVIVYGSGRVVAVPPATETSGAPAIVKG